MPEKHLNLIDELNRKRHQLTRQIYAAISMGLVCLIGSACLDNSEQVDRDEMEIRMNHISATQTAMPPEEKAELRSLIPREIWQAIYSTRVVYESQKLISLTSIHLDNKTADGREYAVVAIANHTQKDNYEHPEEIDTIVFDTPSGEYTVNWPTCYPLGELLDKKETIQMALCLILTEHMPPGSQPLPRSSYNKFSTIDPTHTYISISYPHLESEDRPNTTGISYYDHPQFISIVDPVIDKGSWNGQFYGLQGGGGSGGVVIDTDTGEMVAYLEAVNHAYANSPEIPPLVYTSPFPSYETIQMAIKNLITHLSKG